MSLIRSKRSNRFEQKYLSVAELATRWSVSPSAIYSRKCGTSALCPIRFGKSIRFLRTEVEAFERTREARASKAQTSLHNDRPASADLAAWDESRTSYQPRLSREAHTACVLHS